MEHLLTFKRLHAVALILGARMFNRWLAMLGIIMALAGCGAASVPNSRATEVPTRPTDVLVQTPPPSADASTSAAPATPTTNTNVSGASGTTAAPDAATTPSPNDVLARWSRVGGFAGLQESVTVYADGRLEVDRNGTLATGQVPELTMEELRSAFASDAWHSLDAEYGQPYADAFAYTITTGGKSVQTYDGVEPPEPLATLLEQFAALYDAAR